MTLWSVGLALTALASLGSGLGWGPWGAVGAGAFGLVATIIQVAATRLLLRRTAGGTRDLMAGVAMGMGLRLGGVVLLAAAVLINRTVFPPLPAAIGFLGVLLPLLALEMRQVR